MTYSPPINKAGILSLPVEPPPANLAMKPPKARLLGMVALPFDTVIISGLVPTPDSKRPAVVPA